MSSLARRTQSFLQKFVGDSAWRRFRLQAAAVDKDQLDAVQRAHAGAWLAAFPCQALGLRMPPDVFVVSAKMWLGLVPQQDAKALRRPGVNMYDRPHQLRDCIYEAARMAHLNPWKEVDVDRSGKRPADVFIPAWSRGRSTAIDVTVTHFSQATINSTAEMDNKPCWTSCTPRSVFTRICAASRVLIY